MIVFNPPIALPFIPASQTLARVAVDVSRSESANQTRVEFHVFDAKGQRIALDLASMPVVGGRITPQQCAAIAAAKTGLAGDTMDQVHSRAALPFVQSALGTTAGVVA